MRVILGTTPIETMTFMLDLPPMQTRQEVEQVKAYTSVPSKIPTTPDIKGGRPGGGKSWMGQAEDSTLQVCQLTELKQTKEWEVKEPKPIPASL